MQHAVRATCLRPDRRHLLAANNRQMTMAALFSFAYLNKDMQMVLISPQVRAVVIILSDQPHCEQFIKSKSKCSAHAATLPLVSITHVYLPRLCLELAAAFICCRGRCCWCTQDACLPSMLGPLRICIADFEASVCACRTCGA